MESTSLDLKQSQLARNLERLIDNQPDTIEALNTETQPLLVTARESASFTSSRTAFRLDNLDQSFPTFTPNMAMELFPLVDPLDLDVAVSWSVPGQSRSGHIYDHAVHVGPRSSIVEDLRQKVDAATARGSKQTRTMYEETGRLRTLLLDSVLDGELSREDDPLIVRAYLADAKAGAVAHDFELG